MALITDQSNPAYYQNGNQYLADNDYWTPDKLKAVIDSPIRYNPGEGDDGLYGRQEGRSTIRNGKEYKFSAKDVENMRKVLAIKTTSGYNPATGTTDKPITTMPIQDTYGFDKDGGSGAPLMSKFKGAFELSPGMEIKPEKISSNAIGQVDLNPWLAMQNNKMDLETSNLVDQNTKQGASNTASAWSQLAMKRGLSGGAAERLASQSEQASGLAAQGIRNQRALSGWDLAAKTNRDQLDLNMDVNKTNSDLALKAAMANQEAMYKSGVSNADNRLKLSLMDEERNKAAFEQKQKLWERTQL